MEWDEAKRQWTLKYRGLDFADAVDFDMATAEHHVDRRHDYGESASFRSVRCTAGYASYAGRYGLTNSA